MHDESDSVHFFFARASKVLFKSALVDVTLSQQPTLRAPLVHTSARYSFPTCTW